MKMSISVLFLDLRKTCAEVSNVAETTRMNIFKFVKEFRIKGKCSLLYAFLEKVIILKYFTIQCRQNFYG